MNKALAITAVSGILMGSLAACGGAPEPPKAPTDVAAPGAKASCSGKGSCSGSATPAAPGAPAAPAAPGDDKKSCSGKK